jgi:cGMP-dependent protein kinase
MAPEVIIGKGYGLNVDLWSVGIMLYEFLCGGVPFGEEEEDPYVIYEKVLERALRYPNFLDSKFPARSFIEVLLDKNPAARNMGGYQALKQHTWLSSIDFRQLIRREINAPFKPQLKNLEREVNAALQSRQVSENVFLQYEDSADD